MACLFFLEHVNQLFLFLLQLLLLEPSLWKKSYRKYLLYSTFSLNSRRKYCIYVPLFHPFPHFERKVMISNMFHIFLQFQFLNSSLLFNLSFICNFANNAIFNFCIAAIHSFPVLNSIKMLNKKENVWEIKLCLSMTI